MDKKSILLRIGAASRLDGFCMVALSGQAGNVIGSAAFLYRIALTGRREEHRRHMEGD
ncbi:hypothetical protein [Inquilinus limosus]|uniref:hypothetical protein n=1 Tax=Inquilinus limosus TaxID=171674 RepID=UPI003F5CDA9E